MKEKKNRFLLNKLNKKVANLNYSLAKVKKSLKHDRKRKLREARF